ncbi:hypothetical protein MANES_10G110180v8 [Manihot esculenta]|uniref:Uncharacterized protein n=1 Tax=Manihot esculenta TaxID=3983 RepID=A0ACB7H505_MANES|nr:hypothetical protein MANES_10G110180v8 [Manihot esculenta]
MKQSADKKCIDVSFSPGDLVYLKLQPYRQQSVSKRAFQKLANRFYGPFPVIEKIGNLAYKLQLPATLKIHPVFHVFLLKQHVGAAVPISNDLPQLTDDGYAVLEPKKILDARWTKTGNCFLEEVLVRWKNLPLEDATWEHSAELQLRFPHLNLEDKIPSDGGGNDTPVRRSTRVIVKNRKFLN